MKNSTIIPILVFLLLFQFDSYAQLNVDSTYIITKVDDSYPSWSPDSRSIVFQSNRNTRFSNIYVMNADGSNIRQLTDHVYAAETPTWSPDGNWILYSVYQDSLYINNELFMIKNDGSSIRQLTNHPLRDGHAKFSSDGETIIFNSQRDDDGGHELENYELYEMDLSGNLLNRLTDYFEWDTYPSYSPDGTQILWRRILADTAASRGYNSEIYTMKRDRTAIKNITNHPSFDGYPVWSPDGKRVAFSSSRNGESTDHLQLYDMKFDGSDIQQITWNQVGEQDVRPAWSPDGKKLAFNRVNSDGARIYILEIHMVGD